VPWLLEGEWTGSSGAGKSIVATLEKSASGFLYRVDGGKRVWPLRRDGTTLTGESMMGAEFLRSQRVPEMIIPKVLPIARGYLTLTFSESTCELSADTQQDRVWWQLDAKNRPTGKHGVGPKDPKHRSTSVLRWKRSIN
jgi:hypothetical protein